MSSIPGLEHLEKEGWELVRIGKPVFNVDWVVSPDGEPRLCDFDSTYLNRVIIRKIEPPKQYRAFENAAEFEPHRDRWIRRKSNGHKMRTTSYCDNLHFTGNDPDGWLTMFNDNVFDDDGSPFGVEVTS